MIERTAIVVTAVALTACSSGSARPAPEPLRAQRVEPPPLAPTEVPSAEEPDEPVEPPLAPSYALGPLPDALAELRWPEPPRVRRAVRLEGGGAHSVSQPGTRVIVEGPIERLEVRADDVEVLGASGARVGTLAIERGVARVRVGGGRYGAIELAVPARFVPPPPVFRPEWRASDVTIDSVEIDAPDTALAIRGVRVAILRSRVRAARYSVWCGDTEDFQTEDLVIAGNQFDSAGPESTVRLVGVRRAVVVDNTLSNTLKHDFRVHGVSDAVLFARNRLVNTGIMVGSMEGDAIGSVWILDNEVHHVTPSLFEIGRERVERLVARGNRVFSDRWDCFVCGRPRRGWEIGDNTVAPYRPFTPR